MQSPVEGTALVSGMVRSLLLAPASVRNAPLLQCCWMMHLLDGFFPRSRVICWCWYRKTIRCHSFAGDASCCKLPQLLRPTSQISGRGFFEMLRVVDGRCELQSSTMSPVLHSFAGFNLTSSDSCRKAEASAGSEEADTPQAARIQGI